MKHSLPQLAHATCLVNPVSVIDVAALIPELIANQTYFARKQVPIGGPDVYSWSALADLAADIVGRRRRHTADVPSALRGAVMSLVSPFKPQRTS